MASFNENNIKSKADWVNALKRTTKAPLDRSSIFGSYDDAVLYASGGGDSRGLGGSSYIGQVITVYEDDKVDVYVIDSNKTLKGVGGDASPIGYGESEHSAVLKGGNNQVISEGGVALGKDNVVGLKGWYYKAISFNSSNGEIQLYLSKTQQVPKAVSSASQVEQEKDIAFPLSVGTIVSLVNDVKYDNKFKIERIDELSTYGRIKLSRADGDKTLYFSGIKVETDLSPEDYSIYCLSEPTTGIVDLGQSSFVTGDNNKAINGKSISFGINNTSWGKCAFTEGMSNEAGYAAHAEGKGNKAIGNHSHAEGQGNEALTTSSHAEGATNITSGPASHIEGKNNYIGQKDTTVVVQDTSTKGYAAHAEGQANVVLGNSAHAEGIKNKVYDNGGHAEGRDNVVKGIYAHAEGRGNITNNECEHASGKYNVSTPKTADNTTADATQFSIGIGSNTSKRKNAFEVKQNGDIYIEGVEGRIQDKLNEISQINKTIEDNEEVVAAALNKLNENINNNCDNSRVEELQTLITNMQTYINALETRIVEIETVISQITVQNDN